MPFSLNGWRRLVSGGLQVIAGKPLIVVTGAPATGINHPFATTWSGRFERPDGTCVPITAIRAFC